MCEKERGLEHEREWKLPFFKGYFLENFGFLVDYLAKFGTSSDEPRDEYRLCRKYCIDSPLLYVPSQDSGIGYIFSKKMLENIGFVTKFLGNQNYYAKALVLPTDIEQYGEIIYRDEYGSLIKLKKDSIKCNVYLLRVPGDVSGDSPVYAMLLKYHNIPRGLGTIKDLYDESIFIHLNQMLCNYAQEMNCNGLKF